ncbi:uncharacterized protein FA14DRAFT_28641 [Meira miltonrushii]|uniref:Uncharacterized protein n=1 Tax=Meira miltonrushii TaxID=1280837 RepID=A0A316V1A8_9BASI|nr:uncharacterized protein FA14DRAFT_28641 [Meira miltonrushii]PWN31336.1 hypothetical protein FA14DRAFT_28641 [Meira miltonrushii]
MSIWTQRGIGYAFSMQRSLGHSSRIHSSQKSTIQPFRPSIYSFTELPKRFYGNNERYTESERDDKEDDEVSHTRCTSNKSGSSTLVHQRMNSQAVQFFSPRTDRIVSEEALENLLNHCDRAIVLSRGSSDANSFWTAKDHLFQATRIYVDLVKRSSLKSDIDVLSYETYLIRSGYAHVIRTIGALIGRDGVIVCARMMQDLLQWEMDLLDMDFESADGSDAWHKRRREKRSMENGANQKPLKLDEEEAMILEEAVLSSGPFLQDLTPILYDIFNDLTSESVNLYSFSRKFISKEHESIAMELRLLLRQVPHNAWERPLSMEWNRFRTSTESFNSASSVIDASIRMIAQAYAKSAQTSSTVQLLLDEMAYCNSTNKHVVLLQQMVTQSFRYQLRLVTKILIDENEADAMILQEKLKELLETFDRILSISSRGVGKLCSTRSSPWHTKNFTTILRCLFNSIRLFENPIYWHLFESEEKEKVVRLSFKFRSWLEHCIEVNDQIDRACLPKNSGIGVFNMILHNFMVSSPLFGKASVGMASKLIDNMLTSDDAPQPDEITLTILIGNSVKLRDAKLLRSAILAAHLSLSKYIRTKSDRRRYNADSVMCSLLRYAAISNDRARIIALLDAARFASLYPRPLNGKNKALLDVAQISAQKVIVLLYPSLQIDRPRKPIKRVRIRKLKATRKRERKLGSLHSDPQAIDEKEKVNFDFLDESHVPLQFHPSVLVAALHFAVEKGNTGLAERIWRLWLRVIKRQAYAEGNVENYVTVRALTMLNGLYAMEVRRDFKRNARLKAYSAMIDCLPSSVGPRIYGAKRGHRLALSLRSRRTVVGWAYELGRNPNIDPELANRWKNDGSLVARKVTRLRYLQMRDFWLSNQENNHSSYTTVKEAFENFNLNKVSPIPTSQIVPSERPDHPFYRSLLCVFREKGEDRGCFDERLLQQDASFLEFFRLINIDMETFGLEVPSDLRIWISKHDQ